jgi:hypothetical protein
MEITGASRLTSRAFFGSVKPLSQILSRMKTPLFFFICSVGAVYQQMKHCFSRIASEIPLRIATTDRA